MKREIIQNLYGNELYNTACSLLVISKNSCSKLHYQKGFDSTIFSYQISLRAPPCHVPPVWVVTLSVSWYHEVEAARVSHRPGASPKPPRFMLRASIIMNLLRAWSHFPILSGWLHWKGERRQVALCLTRPVAWYGILCCGIP